MGGHMKRRQFLEWSGYAGLGASLGPKHMKQFLPALDLAADASSSAGGAFSIHPENRRYFQLRGRPLVLVAASEHYGSIVNRRFDFERYLQDAALRKQTVTRTFLLYREMQSARNPYSPLKPESPDFVMPFPRTGPGTAKDGELKYD